MFFYPGKNPIIESNINHIIIRATNWVGDVIMTLPALEAVKECFPNSTLAVLARPWVLPLFNSHPMVDEVMEFRDAEGPFSYLSELRRVSLQIRKRHFDLAIIFQNAFEAALVAFLGGVKTRIGYATDHRGFLLSLGVRPDKDIIEMHQVEYYLSILRSIGCDAKSREPKLYVSKEDGKRALSILSKNGVEKGDLLLGLSPGAIFGPAKRWPPDRFAAIGDRAAEAWGAKILLLGSVKERDICSRVSEHMKSRPINLCGQTDLCEVMGLIKRCDLFVSNDSGLMHIAAALDVPLVAVFGSTDPVATGPTSHMSEIIRHPLDCSPCLRRECPRGFICMLGIEPEEVWVRLKGLKEKNDVQGEDK